MNYIAFLQSIKIGRQKLNTKEIEHLFLSLGFKNINILYQSGNILFESNKEEMEIRKMIEKEIIIRYRQPIPVVLRTKDELKQVVNNCPYTKKEGLYVILLKEKPQKINILENYHDEEFQLINREIYILSNKGPIRYSNLVNNIAQIDIHATIRDWLTVKRLYRKMM